MLMIKVNDCELVVTTRRLVIAAHLLFILLHHLFGGHMGNWTFAHLFSCLICCYSFKKWCILEWKICTLKKKKKFSHFCCSMDHIFPFPDTSHFLMWMLLMWPRYMAPPPPPYDPYGGYPVPPVPMPPSAPVPAPSSYVPVLVIHCAICLFILLY